MVTVRKKSLTMSELQTLQNIAEARWQSSPKETLIKKIARNACMAARSGVLLQYRVKLPRIPEADIIGEKNKPSTVEGLRETPFCKT